MCETAHKGGLLAHPDLTHVDALAQLTTELAHELAKVHTVLRREVAHDAAAVKEVLDTYGLHVKIQLIHRITEDRKRILTLPGKPVGMIEIRPLIIGSPLLFL